MCAVPFGSVRMRSYGKITGILTFFYAFTIIIFTFEKTCSLSSVGRAMDC